MSGNVMRQGEGRVSFAELFYDLVFVFAITQVSHYLLHHFDLAGAGQATFLFLAIWWTWIYSTWVFNRLDPEVTSVRLLLFAMMAGGLFLSMSIPEAFGDRGLVFALSYFGLHLLRTGFVLYFGLSDPRLRAAYTRILLWFLLAGLFWILGALGPKEQRMTLWIIALGLEFLGPMVGFWVPGMGKSVSDQWDVLGGHMAERCGLFVIICLGELLLISGATFADLPWDGAGLAAFASAFLGSIGMWWVYFHIGHKRGTHHIEHAANPGAVARLAFTYLHIPIVAGVVLSAVGAELTIAHPHDPAKWGKVAVIVGSTALFLFGNGLFKRVSADWFPLSHVAGLGMCALLAMAAPLMDLMQLNLAAAAILWIVGLWEDRSIGGTARRSQGGH